MVLIEFTKILLLSETNRRPTCLIGDLNMLHRRPGHPSLETDMSDRRPVGDRHAQSKTDMLVETHRRQACLHGVESEFKYAYLYILFAYLYWNDVRTLIRHVGLRPSMFVSDVSPIRHVCLRCVSDRSPIKIIFS